MAPETQPLTNEPVITSPSFTESIRTFTHSGGAETQTTHTITIGQNTICDILIVGGGGGGGCDRAGGGGSGALILSIGNILSGTYTIKVGNGGTGAVYTSLYAPGQNGFDCEILNSAGTVIFRAKGGGGGQSLNSLVTSGGSGGGASSQNMNGGLGGNAVNTNIVNGITTGPSVTTTYGVYGNIGGRNINPFTGNYDILDGAGGGGFGFALFNTVMFTGRMTNATIVTRFGVVRSIMVSASAIVVAGVLMAFTQNLWLAIAAFAILGFGAAGPIPTALTAGAKLVPGQNSAFSGALMSITYVSFIVCAPLIGNIAELTSLQTALITTIVVGVCLFGFAQRLHTVSRNAV